MRIGGFDIFSQALGVSRQSKNFLIPDDVSIKDGSHATDGITDLETEEMSRTEKTPAERRKGAVIMFALLIGFFALMVYSLQNKHSDKPWATWTKMRDGSGVVYHVAESAVWYVKDYKNGHSVLAYLSEDGFHAQAFWELDCEKGTEIETSRTFSDGSPQKLKCRSGKSLSTGVMWDGSEPRRWREDFDGFKVDTDFRDWDFTKGRQHLTLLKATKATPAKEG